MHDALPKDEKEKQPPTTTKPLLSLSNLTSNVPISLEHADIPILLCCLVSGLLDASVYASWSCFVSMQTGNTIFLALGASHQPNNRPYGWLKSLVSILLFAIGCFTFAQTRRIKPLHRRTLGVSFLCQALCIFVAAALVQGGVAPEFSSGAEAGGVVEVNFLELIPLALLAFQSGGQMMTSRLLGFNEVPTTVLTSVYCDLISDVNLLAPVGGNIKRNRRVGAIVFILVGGICGGWLVRSAAGMSVALWISGAIKLGICVAYSIWKAE